MPRPIKLTLLLFFGASFSIHSQNLIPDSLFSTNSSLQTSIGEGDESTKLMILPNGKFLFGGYDLASCNCFRNTMLRFDVCGKVDSTFGTNGKVVHTFSQRNIGNDYAFQPDGKIVVAGMQAPSNAGSQQIPFVARYNADGSVDNTFGTGGTNSLRFDPVSSGRFFTTMVMSDGRILCVGVSSSNINGGVNGIGAMRFLSNGSLDPTFSGDGITRLPTFSNKLFFTNFSGHLLKDGRIISIGTAVLNGSFTNQMAAAAFDSTGAIDNTFGTSGYFEDPEVTAGNRVFSAKQSDDKIVYGADLLGNASIVIKRLTTSGAIDLSFGSSGGITLPYANGFGTLKGIKILSNEKILLFINNPSTGLYSLHQLTKDGVTDTSFGINGLLTISYPGSNQQYFNQAVELANGQLIVSGYRGGDIIVSRLTENSSVPKLTNTCTLLNANVANLTATYQWFVNGISIPSATTSTYNATLNGTYLVEVTDSNGCKKLSNSIVLNATDPLPTPSSRCGPGSVTVSASGGVNGQYRWYTVATGGTAIAGEVNSSYSTPALNSTTTYYVSINAGTCESFRTAVTATINTITSPTTVGESKCAGNTFTLTAAGGTNGQYKWYNVSNGGTAIAGEVNSIYKTPILNLTTNYFVSISDNGCESPRTLVTATILSTGCVPIIEVIPLSTQVEGKIVVDLVPLITTPGILDVPSIKVVTQPTSGAVASITNGVLTIDYKGKSFFGKESILIEACNKAGVCSQQVFNINVEVSSGDIVVYNAVSPNDDALNPIFFIKNIDSVSPKNQVGIYNRWGDEVFSISDYNNQTNVFAGFSNNGSKLPTGTYFYKITLSSTGKTMTGFLSLKY